MGYRLKAQTKVHKTFRNINNNEIFLSNNIKK